MTKVGVGVNKLLDVKNLHVSIEEKQILNGISLTIQPGQVHAIMGPNGSGKSSFAYTLMGHPRYTITDGQMIFCNETINELSPDKRAKLGLFLAMQHPLEIEGIPLKDFLRQAYNALHDGTPKQLRLKEFAHHLAKKIELLKMDLSFVERPINVGFSGGEKKRSEMLQLAVLEPKLAILDEIDSGLDIDALRIVCNSINSIRQANPEMSFLLITHYQRILDYLTPDFVHVMQNGKIIRSGGAELAQELEKVGYE